MLIVIVDVWVKRESTEAFEAATRENAEASRLEAGIARFDVLADPSDPAHYSLIEVYRTAEAPASHKETAHYAKWRAAVEPMMARPRTSSKWTSVSPVDAEW